MTCTSSRSLAVLSICGLLTLPVSHAAETEYGSQKELPAIVRDDSAAAEAVPAGWLEAASDEIRRTEYRFAQRDDGSWSAPNRAHGLRTSLDASLVSVTSRIQDGGQEARGWRLDLALMSYGREGALQPVEPAVPMVEGARAVYERGSLSEWYVNNEKGLEQGFTLDSPPEMGDTAASLVLVMRLGGDLLAYPSEDGEAVLFKTADGKAMLRYAGLVVRDASGVEVEARIVVLPGRLEIHAQDRGTVYPLTIDPLMTSPVWTAEGDQDGASFGIAVATAGDVNGDGFSDVIVGAHHYDNGQTDEGRAFLYLGSASGLAATFAWSAEGNQTGAQFGVAVATAGDVNGDGFSDVIIGADAYDNDQTDEGRAFLYLGSASGLATTSAWSAESDQNSTHFGYSAALAGDVNGDGFSDIVVGAYDYSNGQNFEGRVFLYLGSASGLATTSAWTAEGDQAGANFGWRVATAGDVNGDGFSDVIVGAHLYDNNQSDEGRAFLYLGSASGLATSSAWITESDQANAKFGFSVGTAGDVNGDGFSDVVVGAFGYDNEQTDEGRAFLYLGSASGLATTAAWATESDQAGSYFGYWVATAGDINGDGFCDVTVGAHLYDNGQSNEGRAFVYLGSASGLATTPGWTAESDQFEAFFAAAVATAGDVNGDGFSDIIVGADVYDNGHGNEGRAFVYLGSASGLDDTSAWNAESDQADALFGVSVATAGDVNGDGFSDVIAGAHLYDNGQPNEGGAFVFLGSSSGLTAAPAWAVESDQVDALFGVSVGTAGDVNGDGFSDVVVGAREFDNEQINEGRAFLYLGSATGLATSAAWVAESDQADAYFGQSVGTAGDVNGDGFSDVIVGAHQYDNGQAHEGRAFVYLGSVSGLAHSAAWVAESNQVEARFGFSVATAGDVNGDGTSDVIVGAYNYDNVQTNEGRTFVYLGSASGLAGSPAWTAESNQTGAQFGISVATAGDINGDGFSDVIAGAHLYDNGQTDEGRAFAYLGSASGLATSPAWTADSNEAFAFYGSVATAGDVNGDGFSDVIVGAPGYDNGQTDEGRAFGYLGSASGLAPSPSWIAESDQTLARFGTSVGSAGDADGDGFSDVIVGADLYDNDETDEGRIFVYFGNNGPGLDRSPRQAREDDTAPIDVLGRSDSQTSFRLKALGRTAAGRGKVRLQFEVKPLGTAFDGTGLQEGTNFDTGVPLLGSGSTAALDEIASNLTAGANHWRLRVLTDSPFFPRSPWLALPYNNRSETDLRTPGCNDVDGDGFGSPGVPNCPAGAQTDCNDANNTVRPGAVELCDNVDNDCDAVVDGFATSCGVGECAAMGTCTAGVDSCNPGAPSPELCDSLDNDCNESTDDGLGQTTCGVGACETTVDNCVNGTSQTCAPGTPSTETCNGIDDDCDGVVDNASVPTSSLLLTLAHSGNMTTLEWTAAPDATGYDVVRGDLGTLRGTGADFTSSVDVCLDNDRIATSLAVFGSPSVGGGFFFLVRGVNCGGNGTYDSGGTSQVGLRDAEVDASAAACP